MQSELGQHSHSTCGILQVRIFSHIYQMNLNSQLNRECFIPLTTIKFRRGLDPYINPITGQSRKKARDPAGNLLLGFSGGLGSTVALDLLDRCYLSNRNAPVHDNGTLKGGINHPRNRTWERATACYVEVSAAFPEVCTLFVTDSQILTFY
jgi:hypothetical protein